jgi:hypothetical protein
MEKIRFKIKDTNLFVDLNTSKDTLNDLSNNGFISMLENQRIDIFTFKTFFNGYKYTAFLSFDDVKRIVLHWDDGPITKVDWDGVSIKLLNEEYKILAESYEIFFKRPATKKKNNELIWDLDRGHKLILTKESRSFSVITIIR